MSRRLIFGLVAGIGVAALAIGVRADGTDTGVTVTTTGNVIPGPGQARIIQSTVTISPAGNATTQPAADDNAPTTQPDAGAATQPAADANAPATQPNVVVGNNGFTVTTTGGMSAGPGQLRVIHSTITITAAGGNIVVQQGPNANPPATQPADNANAPATQPADNGG